MSVPEDFAKLLLLVRSVADDPALQRSKTPRAKAKRARWDTHREQLAERRRVWAEQHP